MKPLLSLLFLASLVGCVTGQPSAFERQAYYVTTNWVPQVTQHAEIGSNMIGTNVVLVVTNIVLRTNMVGIPHLEPRESVKAVLQTGGAVATGLGAPWALPLVGLLWGAYTAWAEFRNSQKKKLNKTLGQNIETYSEVLKAQPNGAMLASKAKFEIKNQQVEAGVKKMAAEVADEQVNTVKAQESAARVIA